MHQNLLDRPDLAADKRTMATYELAQDFHRAGLLDRAEALFTKQDGTPYEQPALGRLLSIYEPEKDWPGSTSSGSGCIVASNAAFARGSTTGAARDARSGRRIRPNARRLPMVT